MLPLRSRGSQIDIRVCHQHALYLDRGDILAARNDDVLGTVGDLDIAVGVLDRDIARMEVATFEALGLKAMVGDLCAALGSMAICRRIRGDRRGTATRTGENQAP